MTNGATGKVLLSSFPLVKQFSTRLLLNAQVTKSVRMAMDLLQTEAIM